VGAHLALRTPWQRFRFGPVLAAHAAAINGEDHMSIRPLHDRVLIKRVEEEQKTKGGIIIPDTAKEKPAEGKVVAVGTGRVLEDGKIRALDVKKGDRVLFGKYSGTEVKVDGDELIIMREDDILCIIEGK